ncbi:MAG: hypothetical protein AAFO94_15270, partial [Bacteroidota bacterium]
IGGMMLLPACQSDQPATKPEATPISRERHFTKVESLGMLIIIEKRRRLCNVRFVDVDSGRGVVLVELLPKPHVPCGAVQIDPFASQTAKNKYKRYARISFVIFRMHLHLLINERMNRYQGAQGKR